ncbi:hypothetical protein PLICRDRAFT_257848 [Plicaturopsis crispa FD-325 SS-3]|nr:hypothetical protein PLICRDRAFT_257848 [Plicaturopsis crispa FD-325 SS-3]
MTVTLPTTSTPPPLDGSLTLPEILDFNARKNPNEPFFYFSRDGSPEVTKVSQLEFARASHRVAHVLRPSRAGVDGAVVAIIANVDTLHYHALVMGLARAGLVPFPISQRNSAAAVIDLLRNTNCHRIIVTRSSLRALFDEIEVEIATKGEPFELEISEAPAFDLLYPCLGRETSSDPFDEYPEPALDRRPKLSDILLYLHSSGSTGFPKPIPQSHLSMIQWCTFPIVAETSEFTPPIRLAAMALPPFHATGLIVQLLSPLISLRGTCLYPPMAKNGGTGQPIIPNSENFIEHARRTRATALITVPTFLETWAHEPSSVEFLKSLTFVAFGGGPLAPAKGDSMFKASVKLRSFYGATEFGAPIHVAMRQSDIEAGNWAWIRFCPLAKLRWAPQDDGTFELQVLNCKTHQVSIENLPDVPGYATHDLFERHPTKPDLAKIVGRLDDVLILSSGEKTVPAPMEHTILESPIVQGAIMFGRQRNQVGILLEPHPDHAIDGRDPAALAAFRNKIWPFVERANEEAPAFSRIFKEMIIATDLSRPMLRTPKGTVMRKATMKLYEQDIEALYQTVEESATAGLAVEPPKSWTRVDVETWLAAHATDIQDGQAISTDTDLFEQGFDSLSATFLRNRIIGALRSSKDVAVNQAVGAISQNIVFSNPTITQLASRVVQLVHPTAEATASAQEQGVARIESMIKKYSQGLGGTVPDAPAKLVDIVVLLTGTTGALGSHLLAALLEDSNVKRVYAYNRPSSGRTIQSRQEEAFQDRGMDVNLVSSPKVVFVEGDASQSNLGLPESTYQELLESTTVIIHNAWRLDFNLSLSSFEPNVRGTRNLVDFALSSPHAASLRFIFTSSIGSVQSWDRTRGAYPEEVQYDASFAVGAGYGESKYVSERLLAQSGLHASSIRIGQISGGRPNGAWATTDWVPNFVKSSLAIGSLPDAEGVASWIPAHAVCQAIVDIVFAEAHPPLALNLVHPRPVSWRTLMTALQEALARETQKLLTLVPFAQWFAIVKARAEHATEQDLQSIPSIKLLEFFGELSKADAEMRQLSSGAADLEACGFKDLSTTKIQAVSPTMRNLEPVGREDVNAWVHHWSSKGFLG